MVLPALNKLFRRASGVDKNTKAEVESSRLTIEDSSTSYGQHTVQIKTDELYEWLKEHSQLLQKLHSGGEMPDLSRLLLEESQSVTDLSSLLLEESQMGEKRSVICI